MNKCRHCGTFVPIEKAFCPNCSEPIEPEEAPNRAASSSSDMMATMRDDPEYYKDLLQALKKEKQEKQSPAPTPPERHTPEADPARAVVAAAPYVAIHDAARAAAHTLPPAKSSKFGLVFVIATLAFLILLFLILMAFEII
jgi:hypothetical protein